MMKTGGAGAIVRLLGGEVAVVQVVDVVIHAATGQLEPIRVASNLVILAWVVGVLTGRFRGNMWLVAAGAIGVYLLLNVSFLAMAGVTNEAQGGGVRVALFVLVLMTTASSVVLAYMQGQRQAGR